MFPVYEEKKENLHLHSRIARHESPHLHNSVEFIYLTEGCLELGMGQELFHMEEGDFAVLFPEVIHHCQVFSGENNKACYLWAQPILCGQFASVMQKYCPKNPVIKKPQVHRDIVNAIRCLKLDKKEQNPNLVVEQAYVQILLAEVSRHLTYRKRAVWRAMISFIRRSPILQNILKKKCPWKRWQEIWE